MITESLSKTIHFSLSLAVLMFITKQRKIVHPYKYHLDHHLDIPIDIKCISKLPFRNPNKKGKSQTNINIRCTISTF